MYSPVLGTFLSRDPLAQHGEPEVLYDNNWFGDRLTLMRNLYAYASGNPTNRVDPLGLACKPSNPPSTAIPDEDPFHPVSEWRPRPPRGYPLPFGAKGALKFSGITCDCCTMNIEVVARGYRYYRWEGGQFVGYNGGPIGTSNDPRDFFSLVVVTVCKTNVVCCGKKQPDEVDRIVSEPLQRDGLGVFIRQGAGDIETTVDRFKPGDPCYVGEDLVTWVKRETTPGRIDPRLPRR